ncbi:MAG: carbohydrate ABC transporter permease, partial [Acholeplasmataceae bacterium]|nr:carbohydrate ABC transporter permease [Acholeplasmataceae bacterium]
AFIVLDYGKSLLNSLVLSIGVTLLQLFVCALAGYSFARLKFKGQKLLFGLVLATIVIAPTTIELPLKNSLINFLGTGKNLIGKPFVLYMFAFLGLGVKAGIFIYLFRQFFKNVPKELEESAYIDGCNPIQTFFRVMLPNAKGAIILTVILTFVWTWNDTYYISNFVTTANFDFNTLTTKIMGVRNSIVYALQTANVWQLFDSNVNENPLFTSMILNTAAILTMIPLIIIYFLVQKALFTEGVERSGIVG